MDWKGGGRREAAAVVGLGTFLDVVIVVVNAVDVVLAIPLSGLNFPSGGGSTSLFLGVFGTR